VAVFFIFAEKSIAQTPVPCGEQLSAGAVYKNVPALSNDSSMQSAESCAGNGSDGLRYQCVEYVRRFYRLAKQVNTSNWRGNAITYFTTFQTKGLTRNYNNNNVAPAPDDILVFDRTTKNRFGHVAIITEVTLNAVRIIEQNNSYSGIRSLPLTITLDGRYLIGGGTPVLGWLRLPPRDSVSTKATFNTQSWSGSINYNIVGPNGIIIGNAVPGETANLPTGQYTFVYQNGGPQNAVLTDITPSPTQTLSAGGFITFTLNFYTFVTTELLPYQSTGYRYKVIDLNENPPTGYEEPGFDDSSWALGNAAFGYSVGYCSLQTTVGTPWQLNSRLLIRRSVSIPANSRNVLIKLAIDNDAEDVFFNGTRIGGNFQHIDCPHLDDYEISVPQYLVQTGQNIITYRLYDYGGESFFDTRIFADVPTN
jgi:hypothetical protein